MSTRTTRSAAAASVVKTQEALKVEEEPQQLSSPPATPAPAKKSAAKKKTPKPKVEEASEARAEPITPASSRKRTRAPVKKEEDPDELPHNLGPPTTNGDAKVEAAEEAEPSPQKKRARTSKSKKSEDVESLVAKAATVADTAKSSPAKKAKKAKDTSYGLTPGQTPYPDWPHPTPEECQEVNRILSKAHGEVKAPKTIPMPSLEVSGCGEVPSVLDALIRTRLSAATTGANSSRAFQGLVKTFGIIQEGVGKGSVDWDKVRRADLSEVFEAIKSGGLAKVKSKDIKDILQRVYEENQARKDTYKEAEASNKSSGPAGADNASEEDKKAEVERAESNVLSLDHLHMLSNDEAFAQLVKYPGIDPKTASCVLLFCLQRPSFAVDTHVFRLCKYLRWVPPDKATRNSTYAHCEVRVPDDLKYPLHQLLIRHGKSCPRCRAATGEGGGSWKDGCPIDHLVTRTGARKGGVDGAGKKGKAKNGKAKKEKGKKRAVSEESSELSDVASEDLTSEEEAPSDLEMEDD
ncbi:hypothetical protein B0A49_01522 [Cryomyces minteri]|uniref:HhH-GPD domain-containing protein n=2 Tax=Cryomyces minteri TaxID=331657 RepID=A0A4U0XWC9_9PEZI|nr:hypothetical protein B0A49_01522 [Cryomyces minteri]